MINQPEAELSEASALKKLIVKDVEALKNLHSSGDPQSVFGSSCPILPGLPMEAFAKELDSGLTRDCVQIVGLLVEDERKSTGCLRPSRAMEIVDQVCDFAESQRRVLNLPVSDVFYLYRLPLGLATLRRTLIGEVNRLRQTSGTFYEVASHKAVPLPRAQNKRAPKVEFPNRAAWLIERLRERGWNKHDIKEQRGPDHKTVQKLLHGFGVRENVLERLANALSKKGPKVLLTDIPSN